MDSQLPPPASASTRFQNFENPFQKFPPFFRSEEMSLYQLFLQVFSLCYRQCNQIGRFIALWETFQKPKENNYFAQIIHSLRNFYGVEIFLFCSEIIFGQVLWKFGDLLLVTLATALLKCDSP